MDEDAVLKVHLQRLRMLIIARGGFIDLLKDPAMNWIITWYFPKGDDNTSNQMLTRRRMDIVNAGELSAGLTPLSCHAFHNENSGPRIWQGTHHDMMIPSESENRSLAKEFIGAYRNFHFAAQRRAATSSIATFNTAHEPSLPYCLLLRPGTPTNRLLTDPASSIALDRVVTLLYLNIIIWDCHSAPGVKASDFINRLRVGMLEQGLDVSGSLELLLWLLMTDPIDHNIAEPERLRLLARLLRVEKRLGSNFRRRLEDALLQFLIAGDEEFHLVEWSPDQFRSEVMHDLALSDNG